MVAEAAVIGHFHPKWSERPLLVVVRNADGQDLAAGEGAVVEDGQGYERGQRDEAHQREEEP